MALRGGADRALAMIRTLPRLALNNLRPEPLPYTKHDRSRGQHGGKRHHAPQKGAKQRQTFPRLGFEGGQIPFYVRIPCEHYYKGHHLRRQYPPISLYQLQLLIDTNRINTAEPIDLVALSNTKVFRFDTSQKHFGFNLTDDDENNVQGSSSADIFRAKVNIEVQWTTERVIAAIEKNGGTITTAYYDIASLNAAKDAATFFRKGVPIPKRMVPPEDAIEYYTDPKFRGYLADPEKVAEERLVLAQKYGYKLPDLNSDPQKEMLLKRKDPRQLFYDLEPGWVVNLRDKCILKPKDETLTEYYRT